MYYKPGYLKYTDQEQVLAFHQTHSLYIPFGKWIYEKYVKGIHWYIAMQCKLYQVYKSITGYCQSVV